MRHALLALVVLGLGCSSWTPPAPPPVNPFPPPEPVLEKPAPRPSPVQASVAASSKPAAPPKPLGPAPVAVEVPPAIRAIVDAQDRSATDKALDAGRHPGELLAFFGVKPGMTVAELGAGGGYTAELLARLVGEKGKVYGQNTKSMLEKFAEKPWAERLAKPVMKNVVRTDRELADPVPPDAKGKLDAVFLVLIYHDTVWLEVDRAKMNKAVFDALKPGGIYAIVDHSGRAGTGSTETKTLHRIEQRVVREEVERAGFVLAKEGNFLRNPSDTGDWNDSPTEAAGRRGTSDRFVLAFEKPKAAPPPPAKPKDVAAPAKPKDAPPPDKPKDAPAPAKPKDKKP